MTRAEAIANWQNGIDFISKATNVNKPAEPPTKVNSIACWNNWFIARKGNFTSGVALLKLVNDEGPLDPPDYTELGAITEIAAYWTFLEEHGEQFITDHPEIYPIE